jgi:ubiquinone biosynthesis protein
LPLFATNTAAFIHDMDEASTRGSIKAASLLSSLATEAVLGFLADPSVRKIPRRLDHISAALERGELTVRMRSFADPRDVKLIVQLTNRARLLGLFSASNRTRRGLAAPPPRRAEALRRAPRGVSALTS